MRRGRADTLCLALNTAEQGGEEFPIFEEFWIQKPTPESKEIVVFALMDSPSVTGERWPTPLLTNRA